MMNVLLCGYRDWAIDVFDALLEHPKINVVGYYKTMNLSWKLLARMIFLKLMWHYLLAGAGYWMHLSQKNFYV